VPPAFYANNTRALAKLFRHRQLSLSHVLGTKTLSAMRAAAFLDLQLLSRPANFTTPHSPACFESSLERLRQSYGLCVYGYVVIPEHLHLLVNEPERGCFSRKAESPKWEMPTVFSHSHP
jgi:hypothetical protein